jgi:uncharacterized protein YndB with AHSA1/START domain
MSVKKHAKGRSVELEFELPGTPEQVWQAIATGPGISAWFVPTEVEEREGGAMLFHLGPGMDSAGKVTGWQPPHRFAYEEAGWSGEAPPLATELTVAAVRGGTCTVRLVHSLFTTASEWDDELEGMERGWPPFIEVLRIYLHYFAGRPATSIRLIGPHAGPESAGFAELAERVGLSGAAQGEARRTRGAGLPVLSGTVERTSEHPYHSLLLRLDEPTQGVALLGAGAWGDKVHVTLSIYLYGADAESLEARHAPAWHAWFARSYPSAPATQT